MRNTKRHSTRTRISRRSALRRTGAGVIGLAGAVLIGCSGEDEPQPSSSATATPTPAQGSATPAAPTPAPPPPSRAGTWSIAIDQDPPTLNPYDTVETDTKAIGSYTYQRLYKRETSAGGDGGETVPVPDLAVSAESEDGVTWTLRLRDHRFHDIPPVDGRQVTAEDVMFSVNLLRATEAPNVSSVSNWVNVEAPDDSTVVFTLDRPSPTFLEQLADTNLLQILPVEADGRFNPATTMIGGGPWIMRDYQPQVGFEFDANPDYYEVGADGESVPYVDALSISIIPEYPLRLAQFLAGNLSSITINSADVIGVREFDPSLQWFGQASQVTSIFYWSNPQTTEAIWKDDRFRKAVSMALDRDSLTDSGYDASTLADAGLPTRRAWNNFIPAGWGSRWWLDPQSAAHGLSGAFFKHNIAEAKKLMTAVGAEDGFPIPYIYTGRYGGPFPRIAEAQIDMLEAIGLAPQPQIQEYTSTYVKQTFRGDFEGMAFGYETAFPEAGAYFNRLFGDDPANHSNISDPRMDELSAAQSVALVDDDRRAIMHEAQIRNAEQMWYVPSQAGAGTSYIAYQSSVNGGLRDTLGYGAGTEEYIWYWLDT